MSQMTLQEAYQRILVLKDSKSILPSAVPDHHFLQAFNAFGIDVKGSVKLNLNSKDKGSWGKALEIWLGLRNGSHKLDFSDGELKTGTIKKNRLAEDFRICNVWDKKYIREKCNNVLVVLKDESGIIRYVEKMNLLSHPIYSKLFEEEFDKIMKIGLSKVSQSDTNIWIAKSQSVVGAPKSRSLYISGPFASRLFGLSYSRSPKNVRVHSEIDALTTTTTNVNDFLLTNEHAAG